MAEEKVKGKDCDRGCIHKIDNFMDCAMWSVNAKNKVALRKPCEYFRKEEKESSDVDD